MIDSNISQIEIQPFATSDKIRQYIAGYEGRHFEISESVANLIAVMQESETMANVAKKYRGADGRQYSESDLEKIVERCIAPILNAPQTPHKHPFLFKLELLSQSTIEKFSNVLKIVFHKYVIAGLLLCIIALNSYFIANATMLVYFGDLNVYIILGVLLLLLLSSFIHELGHASACRHFNIKHGGVGFGLYLTFPVFYTDVSETWKLKRKERLVVNMAGVYFQLIMLIPFFLFYFFTDDHVIKWFLLTVNIGLMVTLNPFFKFDGYWIVSDLLGVSNLRQKSGELVRYFFRKLLKRETGKAPYLQRIKRAERVALITYTIIVNLFFGFYFFFLLPAFIYHFYTSFPPLMEQLIYRLSSGQAIDLGLIQAIFVQLIFMALIVYMLIRMLKPFLSKFMKRKKSLSQENYAIS
ncbi:MAG: M50 family metallopeptidase [Dysgonamonadaceae bacterium]|jgi:putative peptide zinc metalloprotease protein|nr:M50 family metallopeptidase [Dysgonamonadaceae bacterium]